MRDQINLKINLARYFLRLRDFRSAQAVLLEAEQLVLQTPNYPYWAALNTMLDDARLVNNEDAPAGSVDRSTTGRTNNTRSDNPWRVDEPAAPLPPIQAPPAGGVPPVGAVPPDESLKLVIDGQPDAFDLTPTVLARDVAPFVQALEDLQHAFNTALGVPNQAVIVHSLEQNAPPCLQASGLRQAAQAAQQVIAPWRAASAPRRLEWAAAPAQFASEIARARDDLARALLAWLPGDSRAPTLATPESILPPLDRLMLGPVAIRP